MHLIAGTPLLCCLVAGHSLLHMACWCHKPCNRHRHRPLTRCMARHGSTSCSMIPDLAILQIQFGTALQNRQLLLSDSPSSNYVALLLIHLYLFKGSFLQQGLRSIFPRLCFKQLQKHTALASSLSASCICSTLAAVDPLTSSVQFSSLTEQCSHHHGRISCTAQLPWAYWPGPPPQLKKANVSSAKLSPLLGESRW